MLHHRGAAGGEDEHDRRRNVEKIDPVPASPTDIDHRTRDIFRIDQWIDRAIDQLLNKTNDLINRLAFAMQRRQKVQLHRIFRGIGKQQGDRHANVAGVQIHARLQSFNERFHLAKTPSMSPSQAR